MELSLQELSEKILAESWQEILSSNVIVDPRKDAKPFSCTSSITYLDYCYLEGFENDLDLNILFNGQQFPLPFLLYTS
jgi:hypothetical protein